MKTEIVKVTPSLAKTWLAATNFRNRNVSSTVVNRYTEDISKGNWLLNGESIVIDDNGNVIDGQHRLRAIIKANKPIESVVVRGIDRSTFHTFDIGKRRNHGDVLSISGYANANLLAAGLRLIHAFRSGRSIDFERGSGSLSKHRCNVLELVEKYPGSVESTAYIKQVMRYSELARPGSFGVLVHFEFSSENNIAAEEFFHAAFEGIPRFGSKCPTLDLRKKYGSLEWQRTMSSSIGERFRIWKTTWEKFVKRHELEQDQATTFSMKSQIRRG